MKKKIPGQLFIGTSNITLPGNKSTFPKAFRNKSRLNYYSSLFNTVELNSPFYKIPMAATFKKWAADTKKGFQFSVKLWKGITHIKQLDFDADDINSFIQKASELKNKKGCLLLQFPGKIAFDYFGHVEKLLEILTIATKTDRWRIAVEFRNAGWYTGETFELMDEFGASMVLHDHPKAKNEQLNKNARFIYIRFHGPEGNYKDSYSTAYLQSKAIMIQQYINSGKDVYVYFNNTAGDAFNNARTLQRICSTLMDPACHLR